jgi:glyoxylase-like metal-dependent hydrolase (beta-lactamase superfamily II)
MAETFTPALTEVTDNIWLIRLPLPWSLKSVNVYLLKRDDGYTLIDAGLKTDASLKSLEGALCQLNLEWSVVREIVISHMHPDHVGAAAEIRRRSGARVRMHATEASLVAPNASINFFVKTEVYLRKNGVSEKHIQRMEKNARVVVADMERFVPDLSIEEDDIIPYRGGNFDVLVTPGHSPALLSFYNANAGLLISTDMLLERITPHIGIHPFSDGDPLSDYFESLERLSKLTVHQILPSHGDAFQGYSERIEAMKQHHRKRLDKIHGVVSRDEMHAYDVAGVVWGEDRSMTDRRFALAEALSHLVYLWHRHRVERSQIDGITYWRAR